MALDPNKPRPGGAPKTWKKTQRLNPHERFKMYNPLHMEFKLGATHKQNYKDISFKLNRPYQQEIQKMQINKLRQQTKDAKKAIQQTMFEDKGHLTVSGAEKTYEVTQNEITNNIDQSAAKKMFELNLSDYGSYKIDYTRNGQYIAMAGSNGHISLIRWQNFRLLSEEYFNNDYIHDIKFCMNESMFATAQREAVYIYNSKCVETHVLRRSMPFPLKLEYLPYHFLLTSIGLQGRLVYFDISVGKKVTTQHTNLGVCDVMCSNPKNGIIHCGHKNGVVTLWTPTNKKYVASILAHKRSKITGLSVDYKGNLMCTSDQNGYLKLWDLRKYSETQHLMHYKSNTAITSCTFAQNSDLLAFGTGRSVVVWNTKYSSFMPIGNGPENNNSNSSDKGFKEILEHRFNENVYLQHQMERQRVNDLMFCPYQDVLGVGTTKGFVSLVVPGSGEANYDIFESDPFETRKKRNNKIVYQLLDKLRPDMIQLDQDFIGKLRSKSTRLERQDIRNKEEDMKYARKNISRTKMSGYRGVLRKRYAKYTHMKDLHHRQERAKQILNMQKKKDSYESNLKQKIRKQKMINKLTQAPVKTPNALNRFGKKFDSKQTKKTRFNSRWQRNAKKIYF